MWQHPLGPLKPGPLKGPRHTASQLPPLAVGAKGSAAGTPQAAQAVPEASADVARLWEAEPSKTEEDKVKRRKHGHCGSAKKHGPQT